MPVETYASLLNLRKVLPSTKSNYVAVDRDYWVSILGQNISQIAFDADWYLKRYPDVAEAVRVGALKSALEHYCHSGYFEHRMPYRIEVDAKWYLSEYPDVELALNRNVFSSAQDHFEQIGYQEGRFPYPGFALRKIGDAPVLRAVN
jgi:hypothetical protein